MKLKIVFYFLFILIILLVSTGCNKGPDKYDSFAQCLSEKEIIMYGTDWCSHCKNQKKMFGNSFQYVDYIDCDWNKNECLSEGIEGYPTWIIDEKQYPGEQSLPRLASISGCELVEDTGV